MVSEGCKVIAGHLEEADRVQSGPRDVEFTAIMSSKRPSVFDRLGGSGGHFERTSETICRNFIQGRCQFGSKCRYSHSTPKPHEERRSNHHTGSHRKKRHPDISPESERAHKHQKRVRSQGVSPEGDDILRASIKKRFRSPEEGMVSEDGSELEEGQTVDGEDLEQKRVQLRKQLELLQGKTALIKASPQRKSRGCSSPSVSGGSLISESDNEKETPTKPKREKLSAKSDDEAYKSLGVKISPAKDRLNRSLSPSPGDKENRKTQLFNNQSESPARSRRSRSVKDGELDGNESTQQTRGKDTVHTKKTSMGDSSNDDSISSVLVEEAHMGEDDQDEAVANDGDDLAKSPAEDKEVPKGTNGLSDKRDKKRKSAPVDELDSDEEQQFSDWSSEEDDLLAKDEEKERSASPIGSDQAKTNEGDDLNGNKTTAPEDNGVEAAEDNLLEEAEAISDDDLEALIEEDNEPGLTGDYFEENSAEKKFQPAPIYDALEIDWESLVKGSKKPDLSPDSNAPTGAIDHWSPQNVLLRIGVSYDLCGKQLAEEVEKSLPVKLHSTVAGLHVALSREAADLRDAFENAGGLYARALSARRDLQLRKKLAAVKETIPEERDALFDEAVKMFRQIVSAKL